MTEKNTIANTPAVSAIAVTTITGILSLGALDKTSLLFCAMNPLLLVGNTSVRLYKPAWREINNYINNKMFLKLNVVS